MPGHLLHSRNRVMTRLGCTGTTKLRTENRWYADILSEIIQNPLFFLLCTGYNCVQYKLIIIEKLFNSQIIDNDHTHTTNSVKLRMRGRYGDVLL